MDTQNNYRTAYEKDMSKYKELLDEYNQLINDSDFIVLQAEVPYKFIAAKSIYDTMVYFAEEKFPINFGFKDFNDVYVFYRNFINLRGEINALLDSATIIDEIYRKEMQLNLTVRQSQFLPDDMCVSSNSKLFSLASEILRDLPRYRDVFTPDFRMAIISCAVSNLKAEDIGKLIDCNILKEEDLPLITITSDAEAQRKAIQDEFGKRGKMVSLTPEKTFNLKLKGVTFKAQDGSDRQANIKAMVDYIAEHKDETIPLTIEPYTYTPELKTPEAAYRVWWGEKELGNLDAQVAKELSTKYKNFSLTAEVKEVKGGGDVSFGVDLTLTATFERERE